MKAEGLLNYKYSMATASAVFEVSQLVKHSDLSFCSLPRHSATVHHAVFHLPRPTCHCTECWSNAHCEGSTFHRASHMDCVPIPFPGQFPMLKAPGASAL